MPTKKLYRSEDAMLGGVCAGIAEYFDLDPTLVRIAYIILSIATVLLPSILGYLILWVVIPPKP